MSFYKHLPYFPIDLDEIRNRIFFTKYFFRGIMRFVTIGFVKATSYFTVQISFCSVFSEVLTDLDQIMYRSP